MSACCPACEVLDDADACRYLHCDYHDGGASRDGDPIHDVAATFA